MHAQEPDAQAGQPRGIADEADLPVYLEVGQPETQERSLADIWSALGGELKPSLDLVVIAPVLPNADSHYGPPVTAGPTIGLASPSGAQESMGGSRRGKRPGVADPGPVAEETVPALKGSKGEQAGGVRLRVRGSRS